MKVLVTGGCGFVGHHVVEHILKKTDWQVLVIDKLGYSSEGFDRLRDINVFNDKRVRVFTHDFTKAMDVGLAYEIGDVHFILHIGAESHVDRSIEDPEPFVMSNVLGTMHMLNYARRQRFLSKFVYFSTDEVFGPALKGVNYKEWDRYNSTNPYAATKAGGEELVLAYANTYKLPVLITHTMNVYGERQHPEKFIPKIINKINNNEVIAIHSDKAKKMPGSRHWIHARNVADALVFLLTTTFGKDINERRMKVNIVGEREVDNLQMVKHIGSILGKIPQHKMVDFHSSRPGHDLRYALDGSYLKSLGYEFPYTFEDSLEKTILWMVNPVNKRWLQSQESLQTV